MKNQDENGEDIISTKKNWVLLITLLVLVFAFFAFVNMNPKEESKKLEKSVENTDSTANHLELEH